MRTTREIWGLVESCWNETKRISQENRERWEQEEEERITVALRAFYNRYRIEQYAWREDPAELERLAREHREELLKRQNKIEQAYDDLHADTAFVERLKNNYPTIYERCESVCEAKLLAIALQLSPDGKSKEDPKEIPDRIARVYKLQAEIAKMQTLSKFESEKAFEADFREANPDATDTEVEDAKNDFTQKLTENQEAYKEKLAEQKEEKKRGRPRKTPDT